MRSWRTTGPAGAACACRSRGCWSHAAATAQAWPSRVLWVRYESLLEQPLEQVRRVADFLGGPYACKDEPTLRAIVDASSFGAMKQASKGVTVAV